MFHHYCVHFAEMSCTVEICTPQSNVIVRISLPIGDCDNMLEQARPACNGKQLVSWFCFEFPQCFRSFEINPLIGSTFTHETSLSWRRRQLIPWALVALVYQILELTTTMLCCLRLFDPHFCPTVSSSHHGYKHCQQRFDRILCLLAPAVKENHIDKQ